MTVVTVNLICGFTIGFEYVTEIEGEAHWILEFGFIRILISKYTD